MTMVASSDIVSDVTAITELIRTDGADVDDARRIAPSVVQALQALGIFQLLAPTELGGAEVDPGTFLRVVEAASYADGSTGWAVMIGGCYATFGGLLPPAGAATIFGDPSTISAGAFRPDGVAVEVDGGYRITGRWPLASGSSHANWFVGGCVILRDGAPVIQPTGAPLMREFFFPADRVEVEDTWYSTGLRGTASHHYATTDTFVPDEHTVWFQERPSIERPLYQMPSIAMFATFIGAVPLGIARHAIDEFVALASGKIPVLSTGSLAEKGVAQDKLGRASVAVAAARTHLVSVLEDLWQRVQAGHAPTLADRGVLWTASAHAAHTAVEAIDMLYTTAGASSVYAECALDRCLRDARTAAQHICTQEVSFELAGRALLGQPIVPSVWIMDDRGEG